MSHDVHQLARAETTASLRPAALPVDGAMAAAPASLGLPVPSPLMPAGATLPDALPACAPSAPIAVAASGATSGAAATYGNDDDYF